MNIKFRIWDKINKEISHDCERFNLKPNCQIVDYYDGDEDRDKNSYVIQQYTGLKDKNNKEIYEGDFIQYNRRSSFDGINFEVKWSENNFGWVFVSKNGDYLVNEYAPEGNRYNFIEIVGNIFELDKS